MTLAGTISSTGSLATIGGAWTPYPVPETYLVALILGLVAIGLFLAARRMKKPIPLPRPGRILKGVIVIIWIVSLLFFLGVIRVIAEKTHNAPSTGPILPITIASAVFTFVYLAYVARKGGILSSLGNGFVGAVAGPMIFEFPFDLIVIPLLKIGPFALLIFFGPLFTIIFTTLALLLFSKRTAITKNSLYPLAAMFLVFALWALEGFSYPSNPISFTLNAASKVLSFITIIAMFSSGERKEEKRVNQEGVATRAY
jgi:hypothetical protein